MVVAHANEETRKRQWPALAIANVIATCGRFRKRVGIKEILEWLLGRGEKPNPRATRLEILKRWRERQAREGGGE